MVIPIDVLSPEAVVRDLFESVTVGDLEGLRVTHPWRMDDVYQRWLHARRVVRASNAARDADAATPADARIAAMGMLLVRSARSRETEARDA
jgi:hypothetical protein